MSDLIDRQAAIDALKNRWKKTRNYEGIGDDIAEECELYLKQVPSAQPDYQEVLGWLLAYHTKSFDLHGRYLPHEVISWLINDFTKGFIAERRRDERFN